MKQEAIKQSRLGSAYANFDTSTALDNDHSDFEDIDDSFIPVSTTPNSSTSKMSIIATERDQVRLYKLSILLRINQYK